MTPEQIAFAFTPVAPAALVAMLLGGFLFGAAILWQTPALRLGGTPLLYVGFVFGMAGLVFFLGRGVVLYLDNDVLWPRTVGFILLWQAYVVAVLCGLRVRRWQAAR